MTTAAVSTTTCRACDRPIRLLRTGQDRWTAVELDPIVVYLGLPRAPVVAVTPDGETIHGLIDQGAACPTRAYPAHGPRCPR